MILLCGFWVIAGTIFGSFFNVLIYRVPRRQNIAAPGSHCPQCGNALKPIDLVPIFSFLLLGRRCRQCKASISWQYPIVEGTTGILFGLACWFSPGVPEMILLSLFFSILLLCFVTDLQTKLIPNVFVLPGLAAAWLGAALGWNIPMWDSFLGSIVGFVVLLVLHFISKGGMGMGDVKMLAMIGGFLGPLGVFYTLFGASLLGSVVGIIYLIITKQGRKTPIPFGPFLSSAAFLVWFWMYAPTYF